MSKGLNTPSVLNKTLHAICVLCSRPNRMKKNGYFDNSFQCKYTLDAEYTVCNWRIRQQAEINFGI